MGYKTPMQWRQQLQNGIPKTKGQYQDTDLMSFEMILLEENVSYNYEVCLSLVKKYDQC